jgi:hypothetical protein
LNILLLLVVALVVVKPLLAEVVPVVLEHQQVFLYLLELVIQSPLALVVLETQTIILKAQAGQIQYLAQ